MLAKMVVRLITLMIVMMKKLVMMILMTMIIVVVVIISSRLRSLGRGFRMNDHFVVDILQAIVFHKFCLSCAMVICFFLMYACVDLHKRNVFASVSAASDPTIILIN